MKTHVIVELEVEYELQAYRPGCSTEPPEAPYCEIRAVWVSLPCGKRLFDLGPFLEEDERLNLETQAIAQEEEAWDD